MDAAIDKFSKLRDLELGRVARYQNQGDRLQFDSQQLAYAKRYWQAAENSQEIAQRYQEEINKLEERRRQLLAQHGITDPNYGRDDPDCDSKKFDEDHALQ